MQQEPIINHGTLIDTYNYAAMIQNAANQVSTRPCYRVVEAKRSQKYKKIGCKKKKHSKKNVHRRMLKR